MQLSKIEQMAEDLVSVEKIAHLGTQVFTRSDDLGDIEDLLDDYFVEICDALGYSDVPDEASVEPLVDRLRDDGRVGFLVQVTTPVPRNIRNGGDSFGFSWGYCATRWVYGDTFDEAIDNGVKWCAEYRAEKIRDAANAA